MATTQVKSIAPLTIPSPTIPTDVLKDSELSTKYKSLAGLSVRAAFLQLLSLLDTNSTNSPASQGTVQPTVSSTV